MPAERSLFAEKWIPFRVFFSCTGTFQAVAIAFLQMNKQFCFKQ